MSYVCLYQMGVCKGVKSIIININYLLFFQITESKLTYLKICFYLNKFALSLLNNNTNNNFQDHSMNWLTCGHIRWCFANEYVEEHWRYETYAQSNGNDTLKLSNISRTDLGIIRTTSYVQHCPSDAVHQYIGEYSKGVPCQ